MKLDSFLLPALAGIASASSEPRQAEAYILQQSQSNSEAPTLPSDLAQAIILQRLSSPEQPFALGQLSKSLGENGDEAISYINQFGKQSHPLFQKSEASELRQLVISFSGLTADSYDQLKAAIPRVPLSYTAQGLGSLPVRETSDCAFGPAINPKNSKCWNSQTQYLHYDVSQHSNIIAQLSMNLPTLKAQALDGNMETTIVLMDPAASSDAAELRRRDFNFNEKVMTDDDSIGIVDIPTADTGSKTDKPFHAFGSGSSSSLASSKPRPSTIPTCFSNFDSCNNTTNACSGHGVCIDRFEKAATSESCFTCICTMTKEKNDQGTTSIYRWGGSMCQKRDISTPFWLFFGVAVGLAATIAFSISLLFSVGEEKLPGVIGAGVSRSK
ncbi:hypothetical protein F5Y15DRAFT_421669 [Xylariaceae sp. FL0016]|nr:hypothetical protein F5Y15DRAFT_421669 [Xylariaceae sp. FL0016]